MTFVSAFLEFVYHNLVCVSWSQSTVSLHEKYKWKHIFSLPTPLVFWVVYLKSYFGSKSSRTNDL